MHSPLDVATPVKTESGGGDGYGWYALAVLVAAYVFAFLDRQILNLLVEPLKRDLHLSDTQVSLLQGLSFALFLSIAGLPIGRLIDTRRRITILSLGVAFWSVMTVGCGLARGYLPLLGFRVGVGIGEATMTPSAYSLIGDYFSARRLGLAVGLYSVGAYFGAGLALVLGGQITASVPQGAIIFPVLGTMHGWQVVFLIVGLPGLLVALWASTLREPRRADTAGGAASHKPSLNEVAAYFRANAAPIALVNLCVAFAAMTLYGLSAWVPSFFIRTFGLTAAEVGRTFGLIIMICGPVGSLGAGLLGDLLKARGVRNGRLVVMSAGALCAAPFAVAAMLAHSAGAAFILLAPTLLFLTLAIGSGPATLQEITPNRMRGMQHAVAVLAVNLIGLGMGPTLIALLTDGIFHDEKRLWASLAIAAPCLLLVSTTCGLLALRPYLGGLDRLGAHEPT
jgi:MFS family permease